MGGLIKHFDSSPPSYISATSLEVINTLTLPPVSCITRGGDTLSVAYTVNDAGDFLSPVSNVYLEGPAEVTFTGEVEI